HRHHPGVAVHVLRHRDGHLLAPGEEAPADGDDRRVLRGEAARAAPEGEERDVLALHVLVGRVDDEGEDHGHLVLLPQPLHVGEGLGGVEGVVVGDELDLAAVDAALGVDQLHVGVDPAGALLAAAAAGPDDAVVFWPGAVPVAPPAAADVWFTASPTVVGVPSADVTGRSSGAGWAAAPGAAAAGAEAWPRPCSVFVGLPAWLPQ